MDEVLNTSSSQQEASAPEEVSEQLQEQTEEEQLSTEDSAQEKKPAERPRPKSWQTIYASVPLTLMWRR